MARLLVGKFLTLYSKGRGASGEAVHKNISCRITCCANSLLAWQVHPRGVGLAKCTVHKLAHRNVEL
jgi:hypothetical protein